MDRTGVADATEKLTKGEAANIITRLKHGAQVCPLYSLNFSSFNINRPGILREKDEGGSQRITACREREVTSSTQRGAGWAAGPTMTYVLELR